MRVLCLLSLAARGTALAGAKSFRNDQSKAKCSSTLALPAAPRALRHRRGAATVLPGGVVEREHWLDVQLDHAEADGGETVELFVRELFLRSAANASAGADAAESECSLPCLLYLQGGPGFPSKRPSCPPSGWMKAALAKSYRVLLLDQRGTGRSTRTCA